MKQRITIIITLIGITVLYGLSACIVFEKTGGDPEQISLIASEITDFELPAGYHPDFSSQILGYSVAAYSRGFGPSHIYLIQSEMEVMGDELAKALDELVVGSGDPHTQMTVVETRTVTVRGQETKLVISDYVSSENHSYRQAAVAFQGNGGPALLVFSEPIESWDAATLDHLLASIN